MKILYTKYYLIGLLSIWTIIIMLFLIYDYQETVSEVQEVTSNEKIFQTQKDTTRNQYLVNHEKRSYFVFSTLWLLGIIGIWIGFKMFQKQNIFHSEKENDLKRSVEKFKKYFEDNLAIMLLIDPISKRISDANNSAVKFYGYPKEDFLKMTIYDVNLISVEEINKKMKVAIMQKSNHLSFKHKLANNDIRDVEVYASPFEFGEKKIMSIIVHDVTEQKNAEKALINSKKRLLETSKLLETLFDAVPDVIGVHDNDHNVIRYNKAGYDFLNLTREEVVGKKCYQLLGCGQPCDRCATTEVYKTRKPVKFERFDEKLDGWFEVRAYPIFDDNAEVFRVIELLQDITERKQFINELKEAKEKAEESDRLKSSFLTNMSHEIRTPMNAILGFTELLTSDNLKAQSKKEYVKIIQTSGNHLLDIINDIIDISKIDAEQTSLYETDFDLNTLLFEIYQFFQSLITEKGNNQVQLLLNHDKLDIEYPVFTDKKILKQILINLIGNAIKFTDKGSVEFGYEIKNSDTILFKVKDTGIGMTEDELQFVFDRFRQGDETYNRTFGGTGLGLAISKEFVELLGGKIWVESTKDNGSVFYFTLPLVRALKNEQASPTKKQEVDITKKLDGKTILIVEDEEYSLLVLEEHLKPSGVNILKAGDGLHAIQMCVNHKEIDLILMDIQLPKLDGIQATQRIKKINPDLPIIAQTAHALHEEKQKALSMGFSDYLTKPISRKDLFLLVHSYLS